MCMGGRRRLIQLDYETSAIYIPLYGKFSLILYVSKIQLNNSQDLPPQWYLKGCEGLKFVLFSCALISSFQPEKIKISTRKLLLTYCHKHRLIDWKRKKGISLSPVKNYGFYCIGSCLPLYMQEFRRWESRYALDSSRKKSELSIQSASLLQLNNSKLTGKVYHKILLFSLLSHDFQTPQDKNNEKSF